MQLVYRTVLPITQCGSTDIGMVVVHCKNLRVVLTVRVISVAHSINILSVIGTFLLLWPHKFANEIYMVVEYSYCIVSGQSKWLILTGCLLYIYITRYGSTLYIGIAMVVPIPQYIRKCRFYFQFQVNLTFCIFA